MGGAGVTVKGLLVYGALLWDGWVAVLESLWVRDTREDFKGCMMAT